MTEEIEKSPAWGMTFWWDACFIEVSASPQINDILREAIKAPRPESIAMQCASASERRPPERGVYRGTASGDQTPLSTT